MQRSHRIGPRKVNAAKKLKTEVPKVLKDGISMVTFVKNKTFKISRIFPLLCSKTGNNHGKVLL